MADKATEGPVRRALAEVTADAPTRPSTRIPAAVTILDRVHRKPRQAAEVKDDGSPSRQTFDMSRLSIRALAEVTTQMTEDSPRERIKQRLAALGKAQAGA